ncbi:MAG: polyprenol phosphomannose-dependent alpha 1,6 mannosyltransferase MptB [Ardenticatenaceae bacterium]|nr:polyprenol phosphomannose-dependent alpha 1,6 mannosyltransferase MptB [Ardenticatenaceae bacterium]
MFSSQFSRWIKQNGIWLIFVASLLGYGLAWVWFPLRPYFNHIPLADIRTFTPSMGYGLAYVGWLVGLYGLYWLAYQLMRRWERLDVSLPTRPFPLWLILITTLLLALPLIQTYPINANDIYRYVIRGRISSVYGQNPFVMAPDAFTNDPFLPFAGEWVGATSPYGPIWEMLAAAVTAFSRDNLYLGLILFKAVGLAAHLAVTGLIWRLLAGQPAAERAARTLLWAWNPALLLMFVVDGHNDVLMLFWLLLGWLIMQRRPAAGLVVLLLGALTKPIGLLPLPFFALWAWRQMAGSRARLRLVLWTVVGGGTAAFLTFLPFGSPLNLLTRLQSEASAGASFSPAALILLLANSAGLPLTELLFNGVAVGNGWFIGLLVGLGRVVGWGHGKISPSKPPPIVLPPTC